MRREGTHLTVLARLIDPATGYQTWAGRFDAADSGLLQVQQDLAERVAAGLSLRLTPSDHSALAAGQTTDPVALDAYLRAGQASRPGSPAAFQAAIGAYTSAIARDPQRRRATWRRRCPTSIERSRYLIRVCWVLPPTAGWTRCGDAQISVRC